VTIKGLTTWRQLPWLEIQESSTNPAWLFISCFCGWWSLPYTVQTCCIDSATAKSNRTLVMLRDFVADDYVQLWATAVAAVHSKNPNQVAQGPSHTT
jgi:hypothetical protein